MHGLNYEKLENKTSIQRLAIAIKNREKKKLINKAESPLNCRIIFEVIIVAFTSSGYHENLNYIFPYMCDVYIISMTIGRRFRDYYRS